MVKITQKAPSNIALVKYWGKREGQLPANPSVSFTLTNCYTETSVTYTPEHTASFEFFFEGEAKPSFHLKLTTFFERNGGVGIVFGAYRAAVGHTND